MSMEKLRRSTCKAPAPVWFVLWTNKGQLITIHGGEICLIPPAALQGVMVDLGFICPFFLKWKYIRENFCFNSPRTVTLNFSSTGVSVFSFTWRPLIFKGNYFPPPQHKLHVRLFLGTFRLVSPETALQKGGKLGFIGGQLPFSPKLAVLYHNGISDAESSVCGLTGLGKCNIPTGSTAAFLYYLFLFTYLFCCWSGSGSYSISKPTLCCVIMENLFLLGVKRNPSAQQHPGHSCAAQGISRNTSPSFQFFFLCVRLE